MMKSSLEHLKETAKQHELSMCIIGAIESHQPPPQAAHAWMSATLSDLVARVAVGAIVCDNPSIYTHTHRATRVLVDRLKLLNTAKEQESRSRCCAVLDAANLNWKHKHPQLPPSASICKTRLYRYIIWQIPNWPALYYWLGDIEALYCNNTAVPTNKNTHSNSSASCKNPACFTKVDAHLCYKGDVQGKIRTSQWPEETNGGSLFFALPEHQSTVPERRTHRHRSLCVIN